MLTAAGKPRIAQRRRAAFCWSVTKCNHGVNHESSERRAGKFADAINTQKAARLNQITAAACAPQPKPKILLFARAPTRKSAAACAAGDKRVKRWHCLAFRPIKNALSSNRMCGML